MCSVSYFDLKNSGAWMASTPLLEGIEAIVLRTDLTLRKEILLESETSY